MSPLNATYATQGGTLLFNGAPATRTDPFAAPEASEVAGMGIMGLGLLGLLWRARRRQSGEAGQSEA